MCELCPKCDRYLDRRHQETCEGKTFKLPRVNCDRCDRMMAKFSYARHMLRVHKISWDAKVDPQPQTEVS